LLRNDVIKFQLCSRIFGRDTVMVPSALIWISHESWLGPRFPSWYYW